jgi:hypothetical protein
VITPGQVIVAPARGLSRARAGPGHQPRRHPQGRGRGVTPDRHGERRKRQREVTIWRKLTPGLTLQRTGHRLTEASGAQAAGSGWARRSAG